MWWLVARRSGPLISPREVAHRAARAWLAGSAPYRGTARQQRAAGFGELDMRRPMAIEERRTSSSLSSTVDALADCRLRQVQAARRRRRRSCSRATLVKARRFGDIH
jgi:hypothetical protein